MTFKDKEQNTICGDRLPSSSDEILTGFIRILIRTGRALHFCLETKTKQKIQCGDQKSKILKVQRSEVRVQRIDKQDI
jgi:hypothetical protein